MPVGGQRRPAQRVPCSALRGPLSQFKVQWGGCACGRCVSKKDSGGCQQTWATWPSRLLCLGVYACMVYVYASICVCGRGPHGCMYMCLSVYAKP
jgi:hypothetical protein